MKKSNQLYFCVCVRACACASPKVSDFKPRTFSALRSRLALDGRIQDISGNSPKNISKKTYFTYAFNLIIKVFMLFFFTSAKLCVRVSSSMLRRMGRCLAHLPRICSVCLAVICHVPRAVTRDL